MLAPLSDEWIEQQLAVCEKATKGPWIAQWHAWDGASGLRDQYRSLEQWEGLEKGWGMQVSGIGIDTTFWSHQPHREDLLLIAAASNGYALTLQALKDCREMARQTLKPFKEKAVDVGSEPEQQSIWLVIYGNYWLREVDSVWSTEEKARKRADSLSGDWRVAEMPIDDKGVVDASTD